MTKKEIKKIKRNDFNFVLASVAPCIHKMAYEIYSSCVDSNGGEQWLSEEIVDIVKQVMFEEGSEYNLYLKALKKSDERIYWGDLYGGCIDYNHLNKALSIWRKKHGLDKDFVVSKNILEQLEYKAKLLTKEDKDKLIKHLINYQ